jgi:hypothetical protein
MRVLGKTAAGAALGAAMLAATATGASAEIVCSATSAGIPTKPTATRRTR